MENQVNDALLSKGEREALYSKMAKELAEQQEKHIELLYSLVANQEDIILLLADIIGNIL